MSLLSQFYPSGGGDDAFAGITQMPGLGDTLGGVPAMLSFNGVANFSKLPTSSTWRGTTGAKTTTNNGQATAAYGESNDIDLGWDAFNYNSDIPSAIVFKSFGGWITFDGTSWNGTGGKSPKIISGLVYGSRSQDSKRMNAEQCQMLHNCSIYTAGNVTIYAPDLVDTTSSYIVIGRGKAASLSIVLASLSAASVNKILTDHAASTYGTGSGFGATTINLSSGTSAGTSQLTTAGAAAVAKLQSEGVSVILNA